MSRWSATLARADHQHVLLSNLRLAAVLVTALVAWLAFAREACSAAWIAVPAVSFVLLLARHARVLRARDRARVALRYYERGLSRLAGTWRGAGPDGARFLDEHSYANDLDLFGSGSLFQLLSTATTEAGEETLARWLSRTATASDVLVRQEAVAELRDHTDFRESIALFASESRALRTRVLVRWAETRPEGFSPWHGWLFGAMAVVTVAVVVTVGMEFLPSPLLLIWLAVEGGIALVWRTKVHQVIRRADAASDDLGLLSSLLERIETETFRSARLVTLQRTLTRNEVMPSRHIARLQRVIAVRDVSRNPFMHPFALLLCLRTQAAVAIDRWHAAHRDELTRWIEAVGELEALSSLAAYAFEHPADPFPVIADGPARFDAKGLAHPLLDEAVAVRNDVTLGGASPQVLVVSGSNMSGKSTLLRAIGTNAVMALMGAPVRATLLTITPLAIGATIRVHDSLLEGQSRFYAEILRLREIVTKARSGPLLFLLDEILHGTNSKDRRIGADAILRALVGAGAVGLITTHDLALAEFV
ncbi:MAG: mismatch repair protein, partial [Acidobacteriaceae bacterium]|nr:mismatch repair protein [Acidobacteriaceae bacterium]